MKAGSGAEGGSNAWATGSGAEGGSNAGAAGSGAGGDSNLGAAGSGVNDRSDVIAVAVVDGCSVGIDDGCSPPPCWVPLPLSLPLPATVAGASGDNMAPSSPPCPRWRP